MIGLRSCSLTFIIGIMVMKKTNPMRTKCDQTSTYQGWKWELIWQGHAACSAACTNLLQLLRKWDRCLRWDWSITYAHLPSWAWIYWDHTVKFGRSAEKWWVCLFTVWAVHLEVVTNLATDPMRVRRQSDGSLTSHFSLLNWPFLSKFLSRFIISDDSLPYLRSSLPKNLYF